jgi:hypothetical protein
MKRSRRCSSCCARIAFGRSALLPRIPVGSSGIIHIPRSFREGEIVARKTVLVCDNCGKEVGDGKGALMRLTYSDARRGAKQADLCDDCAGKMPGRAVARRGRRPKSVAA